MLRVLFIGHSGHRSGAPLLLLDFLKWLRASGGIEFDVALVNGGPLAEEYAAVADTQVLRRWSTPSLPVRVVRRLRGDERIKDREDAQLAARARRYDAVYVNTIVPVREMVALRACGVPMICHAHEMQSAADQWLDSRGIAPIIPVVTHFIAASDGVSQFLVDNGAPPSAVTTVHSFVRSDGSEGDSSANRRQWRATLGVADDEFLVGSCGTLDWRKGADLFVQVVRRVTAVAPRARFVWIGADRASLDYRRFVQDLRVCGLERSVIVLESIPNARDVFPAMDAFALTSREDPFPLVMLEAALARLPIVCFDRSGGGPEFVRDDAGLLVPYLDLDAFSARLHALAEDANLGRALGSVARQRVLDCYTIDHQAPKLRAVIEGVATTGRTGAD